MSRKEKPPQHFQTRKQREDYISEYENRDRQKVSYYDVLGVDEDASLIEIKKQFRKCAVDFHPDNKKTGDVTLFALVARAYECFSDSEKRSEYDKMLLIEKKTQKSKYVNQKKAFDEFIKAQDNEKGAEREKAARSKFELDFTNLDSKRGFDRKKYDDEHSNPLSTKDSSRRLDDLVAVREQDEIELTQRRLFGAGNWSPDKFNQLFENKYKKGKGDLVKHSSAPSAFNEIGESSLFGEGDDLYDDTEGGDGEGFASLKQFDEYDEEITEEDIKQLKKMKGLKSYKGHPNERGKDYQDELEKRLRGRETEDDIYNGRKMKDYDTDNKMGGYGFLHQVGLNGRELEEEEEVDNKTMKKLLEFRKNEKRKTFK